MGRDGELTDKERIKAEESKALLMGDGLKEETHTIHVIVGTLITIAILVVIVWVAKIESDKTYQIKEDPVKNIALKIKASPDCLTFRRMLEEEKHTVTYAYELTIADKANCRVTSPKSEPSSKIEVLDVYAMRIRKQGTCEKYLTLAKDKTLAELPSLWADAEIKGCLN